MKADNVFCLKHYMHLAGKRVQSCNIFWQRSRAAVVPSMSCPGCLSPAFQLLCTRGQVQQSTLKNPDIVHIKKNQLPATAQDDMALSGF